MIRRLAFLAALIAAGCAPMQPSQVAPSTAQPTELAAIATTEVPAEEVTPTSAPFVPFTVLTWADNVLLRKGPGYLFPQITALKKDTSLLVLSRTPGGEWLLVQTPDSRSGWVFKQLVDAGSEHLDSVPYVLPPEAQLVRGQVKDEAGVPISGIQFSLTQGSGNSAPRNDAMTDVNGVFYAFMPLQAAGTWFISYTAVACTSNTMDASCNCRNNHCGKPDPLNLSVVLPLNPSQILGFVWK
jgi:SH3 domain-containing protein